MMHDERSQWLEAELEAIQQRRKQLVEEFKKLPIDVDTDEADH